LKTKIDPSSPTKDRDFKFALMDHVLGDDKSDESKVVRVYCEAALPDAESKKNAWEKI
jgi:hypothetical protein